MTSSLEIEPGRALSMGERAVLLGAASPPDARRLAAVLLSSGLPLVEVVPAMRSVLAESEEPLDPQVVEEAVRVAGESQSIPAPRQHRIEVVLDGEDLDEAMERCSCSLEEISAALELPFEVATLGFSPGFGYLSGLRGPLAGLARRDAPRPRVAAGSLAVAAGMAAIYPQDSPGGWWLLGRTGVSMFDQQRRPPALLSAGDEVRFAIVDELEEVPPLDRRALQIGRPSAGGLRVLAAPPGSAAVDAGRRGMAHLGIPRGGAADAERALLAAALVGGADAALEVVGQGLELEIIGSVVVAAVELELAVDGRPLPSAIPLRLSQGQRLSVRSAGRGGRGYLGVGGGPGLPEVLGSMGTDSLAGVGPGWLAPGDVVAAGPGPSSLPGRGQVPDDPSPRRLRVTPGPHAAALVGGIDRLDGLAAVVAERSNRVGIRLEPSYPLECIDASTLQSCGVVTGAVQLPPDGRPIILGVDHASLGGYPVVAVLAEVDKPLLGRLSPGDEAVVVVIDHSEASRAELARVALRASFLSGVSPGLEEA